jgi:hypothetical protein
MQKIISTIIQDAFDYFQWRTEELKTDDRYYLSALIEYINKLESELVDKED